ncbi:MAG: hypothetical protein AAFN40_15155 [Cyanobacteria bacterium J06560_6]
MSTSTSWESSIVIKRHFTVSQDTLNQRNKEVKQVCYGNRLFQVDSLQPADFQGWIAPANTIEHRFNQLVKQWKSDTGLLSDLSKKSMHPAYQRIIGMGQEALPLLLKELDTQPSHWFWALRAITGANPVKSENRGRIKRMAQDWLEWGRAHGYQW